MDEPDVVCRVHKFVSGWRLDGEPAARVFTNPHPTLTGFTALRPFQRSRIQVAGQVVHPDLLCHQSKGNSLFAVEAKGDDELLKGLFQAESYQVAVQRSFLAAPANRLTDIRNLTLGALPDSTLFPVELTQYAPWVICEALHNRLSLQG